MNAEAELELFVSIGLSLSLLWDLGAPFLHWISFFLFFFLYLHLKNISFACHQTVSVTNRYFLSCFKNGV